MGYFLSRVWVGCVVFQHAFHVLFFTMFKMIWKLTNSFELGEEPSILGPGIWTSSPRPALPTSGRVDRCSDVCVPSYIRHAGIGCNQPLKNVHTIHRINIQYRCTSRYEDTKTIWWPKRLFLKSVSWSFAIFVQPFSWWPIFSASKRRNNKLVRHGQTTDPVVTLWGFATSFPKPWSCSDRFTVEAAKAYGTWRCGTRLKRNKCPFDSFRSDLKEHIRILQHRFNCN